MTTDFDKTGQEQCPAEGLLKQLSGKWKPQIFRLALENPLRFNALIRQLPGSSKQSLASALKEMEAAGLLTRTIIREKPLHVEHSLSEHGRAMVEIFLMLEKVV